jgi:fructoselysine-6-P-deglycase FrlB-like protein
MTKATDTVATESTVPAVDLSALTVQQLADMLAKARKAEKEVKAQESALPMFAFVMVMDDSSLVYWSGRAVDYEAAQELALAYAERNGGKVYAHTFADGSTVKAISPRPIPAPRGRKVGSKAVVVT